VLIVLVPASNLRMICVDHAVGSAEVSAGCADLCPREQPQPDEDGTGCVLVAGGCSAISAFIVGLPTPSSAALAAPPANPLAPVREADLYRPPSSPPMSPPPKP
jgi:hypothetical protein